MNHKCLDVYTIKKTLQCVFVNGCVLGVQAEVWQSLEIMTFTPSPISHARL